MKKTTNAAYNRYQYKKGVFMFGMETKSGLEAEILLKILRLKNSACELIDQTIYYGTEITNSDLKQILGSFETSDDFGVKFMTLSKNPTKEKVEELTAAEL
jgi:hypothetical protein